ncbi:single-stranded DNA-binding protein [Leptospira sp. 2 VSF19]|uniref:Single-stranded DNA-binding protein n=1 Tax=Leptospira soteropolitanensis TaxID=2950025 RepID=A0AAW5VKK3_9LEPT|nr:single-stranded DNA-binding protein [Leptospira soteropolitanensis]MCW7493087.1 single-stranded DNA-binding protein [Leptospira soteropolitanensis]MCW7500844.1 single-stranded DNA-binding protein [Leptospira soteropolitanensis]MCW7522937.1 single-stranded DNA-binding protein [Leptospira soteropolitanensis]MCW7526956.1 single-stranded DNA-binding protein [Leptospira soteropolitanensis]MCW7530655.1 single-stranded DNA-binding protein [Leptospira soteropolitanensis]
MANDLNKVLLIGRMTRDPEFKSVNGSSVVNFSIANNRVYVTNGEKKEETHYFDCVAWGRLADILKQYAGKGKQVAIEGRLQQQSWETPEGKKASKIRVYVETAQLLGGQGQGAGSGDRSDSSNSYDSGISSGYDDYPAGDDDIPF